MVASRIGAFVRSHPLLFNACTGGVLCASSDVLAQHLELEVDSSRPSSSSSFSSNIPLHESLPSPSSGEQREDSCGKEKHPSLAPSLLIATIGKGGSGDVAFLSSSSSSRTVATMLANVDWVRVLGAGVIGSFLGGMVYPMAYAKLDSIWVGTQFSTVVQKSLVEIATVGIFVNSLSMTCRGLASKQYHHHHQHEGVDAVVATTQVLQHVRKELPVVTQNDFLVWLPYNILAFSFIPAVLRPTTTAAMEASWQTYISLRSHDYNQDDYDNNNNHNHNHNRHNFPHQLVVTNDEDKIINEATLLSATTATVATHSSSP